MKRKSDPIQNDEMVEAIMENGTRLPYRFGNLKQDFQAKKIKGKVKSVFVPRTQQNWFVIMKPTTGVKFEKIAL